MVTLRCHCGQVECISNLAPMLVAVCYCDDCQAAARAIESQAKGPPVADPDGGTSLCLLRLDGFQITKGQDLLDRHRLRPESKTSRMIARCCNSAMYLAFTDGRFWVSAMTNRIAGEKPPIEMRLATMFREPFHPWPDDAPRYLKFPKRLLFRLLRHWIVMKRGRLTKPTNDGVR